MRKKLKPFDIAKAFSADVCTRDGRVVEELSIDEYNDPYPVTALVRISERTGLYIDYTKDGRPKDFSSEYRLYLYEMVDEPELPTAYAVAYFHKGKWRMLPMSYDTEDEAEDIAKDYDCPTKILKI